MPRQDARSLNRSLAAFLLAAVALTACSGGGDDGAATTEPVVTAAVTTAAVAEAVPTTVAGPAGETFTDPDGEYTLVTGPDWTDRTGDVAVGGKVEFWQVAPAANGFASNVNVVTERTRGMALKPYLDLSVKNLGSLTVLSTDIVAGPDGRDRGVVEYEGTVQGADRPLHFLAVIDVGDELAAIVTFTAEDEPFTSLRAEVEPYLMTITAS